MSHRSHNSTFSHPLLALLSPPSPPILFSETSSPTVPPLISSSLVLLQNFVDHRASPLVCSAKRRPQRRERHSRTCEGSRVGSHAGKETVRVYPFPFALLLNGRLYLTLSPRYFLPLLFLCLARQCEDKLARMAAAKKKTESADKALDAAETLRLQVSQRCA